MKSKKDYPVVSMRAFTGPDLETAPFSRDFLDSDDIESVREIADVVQCLKIFAGADYTAALDRMQAILRAFPEAEGTARAEYLEISVDKSHTLRHEFQLIAQGSVVQISVKRDDTNISVDIGSSYVDLESTVDCRGYWGDWDEARIHMLQLSLAFITAISPSPSTGSGVRT